MADMSEMLKNLSSMMEGQEIPDNLKEMLGSLKNDGSSKDSFNGNSNQTAPNIDVDTMIKMQKIISAMNSSSNSSGANLLRSLKPYLKPSRQAKVDEYIQLLGMEKVFEMMKDSGEKHDTSF